MIAAGLLLLRRLGQINWALADQIIVSAGNFLTMLMLARALGMAEFGRFTLCWMAVLFGGHMQQALILAPMASIGPKQPAVDAPSYFGAVVAQQLLFAGLVSVATGLSVGLIETIWKGGEGSIVLPVLAASCAHQNWEFLRRYFFTTRQGSVALATDALRTATQVMVLFWLIQAPDRGVDAAAALWTMAAAALATALAGATRLKPLRWSAAAFQLTLARHWQFSRWLLGAFAAGWIGVNCFPLIAAAVHGAAAVGAIRAGQILVGVIQLVYLAACAAAPAEASRVFVAEGLLALISYLRRLTWLGVGATAAVTLAFAVAPKSLLGWAFGAAYAAGDPLVVWLAVLQAMMFLDLALSTGLSALERTDRVWHATKWAAMLSLLLACPLVSVLGIHGVVVGWLVAAALKVALEWRSFRASLRNQTVKAGLAHAG
jgi:O-antigen/teichoic acid export membrane protein